MSFSITQSPATIEVFNSAGKTIEDGSTIVVSEFSNTMDIKVRSSISNIKLTSNASWCTATMTKQEGAYTFYTIAATENETVDCRTTKIMIKGEKGDVSFSFVIRQAEGKLQVKDLDGSTTTYINCYEHVFNYEIVGNLPFKVKSNAEWCSVYQSGKNIAITISTTDINRSTSVEITGGKEPIILTYKQTKFVHGQLYDRTNPASSPYVYIDFNTGKSLLYKEVAQKTNWSNQLIATGATSLTDGEANTKKIHSIPNWENHYPAFVAVNSLNTEDESGWYMPACEEFIYNAIWTSTEIDKSYAYAMGYYGNYSGQIKSDHANFYKVVAVKKFNAFDVEDNE